MLDPISRRSSGSPTADVVVDPAAQGRDRPPGGREIDLRLPDDMARSGLTNAHFDTTLATTSKGRNGRSVTKLLELMGA